MNENPQSPDQQSGEGVPPTQPHERQVSAAAAGAITPAAQYAWAKPALVAQWHETPPLEYHQLLRGVARYRWWKPLLGVVLGTVYYFAMSVPYILVAIFVAEALNGGEFNESSLLAYATPDTQNPASLIVTLGSIIFMIPAVWLAMLSIGLTPPKRIWSVALRIRWRWLARTLVPTVVVLIVMNASAVLLNMLFSVFTPGATETAVTPVDTTPDGFVLSAALWSLLIVLLLVPFQATAEEVVFRGAFMQGLGAWFGGIKGTGAFARFMRGPWLPVLVSSITFGFAHIYDIWGWAQVVALAVTAGWLTWRTGGLEAAISLHVINNWVAFGLLASGITGETGQTASSDGGLGSLLGSLIGFALFAWWITKRFNAHGGPKTRIDYVEKLVPQTVRPLA